MAGLATTGPPPAHAPETLAPSTARRQREDPLAHLALVGAAGLAPDGGRAGAPQAGQALARPPKVPALPWEARLVTSLPVSPVAAGWLVSLSLATAAVATIVSAGAPVLGPDGSGSVLSEDFTTAVVLSLLFGYTLCAGPYLNVAIARDLVEAGRMRPGVFEPGNAGWLHGLPVSALRVGRIAGVIGFFVGLGVVWSAGVPFGGAAASQLDAAEIWSSVTTPWLFVLLARAAAMTAFGARGRMDGPFRIPPGEIDLLDMRAHLVEGRIGLRLALVWIVGVTLSSLLFYDPDYLLLMLAIVAAGLGVAAVALLMPARRLHRRIREAKRRELAAVRRRLGPARDAVMAGQRGAEGHLADLLAYADHLTDVREWPFDNHTLSRFVLYLLIPLGSWLGGALVERLVSIVLD